MAAANSRRSAAMERTNQWVFSHDIPTDIVIDVGEGSFPLHKFMLVAKSGYIRKKIMEANGSDLAHIDLSDVPGGAGAFEKVARFCYGVNFEISVHNAAALLCAAEYLEMTESYCDGNLATRAEDFLSQAALKTLPGAVIVLRSCDELMPRAEDFSVVNKCVVAISLKVCKEAEFPTRSPPEWWAGELAALSPSSFQKVLAAMRARGAAPKSLSTAVAIYAEKSLPNLLGSTTTTIAAATTSAAESCNRIESIISILPAAADAPLPVGFLCCLLRAAVFLDASAVIRKDLEKRIACALDQAEVGDLLTVALDYAGERVVGLDAVRWIVTAFVEKEAAGGTVFYGGGEACCSAAMQRVARTMDAFAAEIATDEGLTVSKFAGVAGALPKSARRLDDDLYRAVDIFLKAHPELDELEREKVCSVMDPLKLSYEARLHASQNKRLPLQIVLHALYYDQLKLRGGSASEEPVVSAARSRSSAMVDVELLRENEALRSELMKMKMYVSDLHRGQGGTPPTSTSSSNKGLKKPTFFSSVSKTLGKLISFKQGWNSHIVEGAKPISLKQGSKDTSHIAEGAAVDAPKKPRRRRFSIS